MNCSLVGLNLNSNLIENSGLEWSKCVSKFLKRNHPTLIRLGLGGNQIGQGVAKIGKGLSVNTTLVELDLAGNNILSTPFHFKLGIDWKI